MNKQQSVVWCCKVMQSKANTKLSTNKPIISADYDNQEKIKITTALRPTPRSAAALRGKVIGGAAYAERYSIIVPGLRHEGFFFWRT